MLLLTSGNPHHRWIQRGRQAFIESLHQSGLDEFHGRQTYIESLHKFLHQSRSAPQAVFHWFEEHACSKTERILKSWFPRCAYLRDLSASLLTKPKSGGWIIRDRQLYKTSTSTISIGVWSLRCLVILQEIGVSFNSLLGQHYVWSSSLLKYVPG